MEKLVLLILLIFASKLETAYIHKFIVSTVVLHTICHVLSECPFEQAKDSIAFL